MNEQSSKWQSLNNRPHKCVLPPAAWLTLDPRSCGVWQWHRRRCSEQAGFPFVQEPWHRPHCKLAQAFMGAMKAGLCAGLRVSAPGFPEHGSASGCPGLHCQESLGICLPAGLARTHSAPAKVNFPLWGQPRRGNVRCWLCQFSNHSSPFLAGISPAEKWQQFLPCAGNSRGQS